MSSANAKKLSYASEGCAETMTQKGSAQKPSTLELARKMNYEMAAHFISCLGRVPRKVSFAGWNETAHIHATGDKTRQGLGVQKAADTDGMDY